jgi:hypothetical protein
MDESGAELIRPGQALVHPVTEGFYDVSLPQQGHADRLPGR